MLHDAWSLLHAISRHVRIALRVSDERVAIGDSPFVRTPAAEVDNDRVVTLHHALVSNETHA